MTPPRRPEPALERNGRIGQPGALELMPRLCPMQISAADSGLFVRASASTTDTSAMKR